MTDTYDIGGVIRNSNPWAIINDSDHNPLNIMSLSVVNGSSTAGYVQIDYPTADKIITLLVGPDEYMAQNGYSAGASVDFANAKIYFGHNGSAVAPNSVPGYPGNFWILGKMYGTPGVVNGFGTAWSAALAGNNGNWFGAAQRQKITKASMTLPSGSVTEVHVTFKAGSTEGLTIDSAFIAHASGTAPNYTATGITLYFDGDATSGNTSTTIAAGTTKIGKALFSYDKTSDLFIGTNVNSSTTADSVAFLASAAGGTMYYKQPATDAGSASVTGYASYAGAQIISKIEMDGF